MSATVIDVHSHAVPVGLSPPADTGSPWPRLTRGADGSGVIHCGASVYRTVGANYWSVPDRLQWLDQMKIDLQVVSPLPVLLTYWSESLAARDYGRSVNEAIASFCAEAPDRLVGFGTVPLQAPRLAIDELRHVLALGLSGVEIGTRAGETEFDDPAVLEFFRAAADLNVPILLHAQEAAGLGRMGHSLVRFGIGVPADTAIAATMLMLSGVLAEVPHLRVCLCHGGGAFFWCLPRLRPMLRAMVPERAESMLANTQKFYVDTAGLGVENVNYLLDLLPAERLILGSDFPATADSDPLRETAGVDAGARQRVHRDNGLAFLSGLNRRTVETSTR